MKPCWFQTPLPHFPNVSRSYVLFPCSFVFPCYHRVLFFLPNPLSQYQPLPSSPHRHRRVWALYFPVTTTSSMFLPPQYHPVGNKSSLGLLFNTISVQAFGPRRNLPIIPYCDLKLKRNLRENVPALSSLPPPHPSVRPHCYELFGE